jgi:hypothetical protein
VDVVLLLNIMYHFIKDKKLYDCKLLLNTIGERSSLLVTDYTPNPKLSKDKFIKYVESNTGMQFVDNIYINNVEDRTTILFMKEEV